MSGRRPALVAALVVVGFVAVLALRREGSVFLAVEAAADRAGVAVAAWGSASPAVTVAEAQALAVLAGDVPDDATWRERVQELRTARRAWPHPRLAVLVALGHEAAVRAALAAAGGDHERAWRALWREHPAGVAALRFEQLVTRFEERQG